jgi:hypothetical protein
MAECQMSGLALLWTTAERETVLNMVLPFAKDAQRDGGFAEVRLVAWGPSVRVMGRYGDLMARVKELMAAGVTVAADRDCAEEYGAVDALEAMGVDVTAAGVWLSGMIRDGWKVLAL